MLATPRARTLGSAEIGLSSAPRQVTTVRPRPKWSRRLPQPLVFLHVEIEDRHLDAVEPHLLEALEDGHDSPSLSSPDHKSKFIPNFMRYLQAKPEQWCCSDAVRPRPDLMWAFAGAMSGKPDRRG